MVTRTKLIFRTAAEDRTDWTVGISEILVVESSVPPGPSST
jgi:hypothetical protein